MNFFRCLLMMALDMPSADRSTPRWLNASLGGVAAILAAIAILALGPSSHSAAGQSRIIKAQQGVVQSTVSGSGNVQLAHQLDLGFATAGVVSKIYVSAGQRVTPGQLLAELDPKSAEVTLEQGRATLQSAEAALVQEEETGGESASAGSGAGTHPSASAASLRSGAAPAIAAGAGPRKAARPQTPSSRRSGGSQSAAAHPMSSAHNQPSSGSGSSSGSASSTAGASQASAQSEATKQANLASARAAVKSDRLAVQNDEKALSHTKLYAPEGGTILSLSGEVGEAVSAAGTTRANAGSAGSGAGSGGSGGAGSSAAGRSSSANGSSGSGSSSPFAVLGDLTAMQLVVALSESEVVHVHAGQPATVTVEALEGRKLAAQVSDVAALSSSSNGVVSYQVTFALEQLAAGLRPGMSATAEVVVRQEEGVNVPTSAISGGSVTVVEHGKRVARRVVTGLAGDSATIILSGLSAGEEVVLPLASAASAGASSRLGGRAGGGAVGGGGGLFLRGIGGGAALRGGG
jgi:multidrug efflux pump subunit AcrA (membrane-fusion protein)